MHTVRAKPILLKIWWWDKNQQNTKEPIKVILGTELKNLWFVKQRYLFLCSIYGLWRCLLCSSTAFFSFFFHQVFHSKCLCCSLHCCSGAIDVPGGGFCGVHPRLPGDSSVEGIWRYFQRKNKCSRYGLLPTPMQTSCTFEWTACAVLPSSENPTWNRGSVDSYTLSLRLSLPVSLWSLWKYFYDQSYADA